MPEENLNESMEELCLRLQMEDIQQYHPASKGKQREGIISDFELAMSLYKNELQARLNFQSDERMAKSIARALQGDSEALQVIIDQEAIAGNDRNIAQALQGNENPHIPIRDVVHSNQKTKPKVSRVQQSLEENLRRIALAQDYHVSNVSQDFSLLKVDHRISNAESSRTAASRVTKSSVNEHDILATSEIGRRSCTACTEEIILFDLANLPCEHDYCRDCITRLFSDCMVDESLFPPRCCRINIVPEHVKMFLDPSVVEQFDQKSDELATANRTYCHIQACGAFIPNKTIENDTGICGSCNEATCYICKGPSHRGTDCPQDEALESFLWTAARLGYQRCYSCRRMVELETGCNHMRYV